VSLPPELARVHMVGIGGAGMSGIARILLDRGGQVSGSDAKESRGVAALRARGASIAIGHDAANLDLLPGGATAVITTHAAIPSTNAELVEARRRAVPVLLRPAVLAKLMAGHRTVMVTGTHGKTTTTSMLVVALQHSGFDPSFAVGGDLGEAGTNAHHGSGEVFVAEADESDGSLREYEPDVAVVTNVEADHLDFFGSAAAYSEAFDAFVERIRPGGALVVCADDPGAAALAARAQSRLADRGVRVLRYGSDPAAGLSGALIGWQPQGIGSVAEIRLAGQAQTQAMRLSVPGRHMALNALGAVLAAVEVGAPMERLLDGLAGFEGVRRRFELVGSAGGVRVFDDYAHHPTEVRAALTALRDIVGHGVGGHEVGGHDAGGHDAGGRRSIVVFQPHLYSRTKTFAREFGQALDGADEVFVLDVYAAREQPLAGVSGAIVADHVSVPVHYLPDFSAVAASVAASARPGDVVVTLGAGDVTMLGPEIIAALEARAGEPGGHR